MGILDRFAQQNPKYKPGDRVVINKSGAASGLTGTIEKYSPYGGQYDPAVKDYRQQIRLDNPPRWVNPVQYEYEQYLSPVKPKFNVGDKVKVADSEHGMLVGSDFKITDIEREGDQWLYNGYVMEAGTVGTYHGFYEHQLTSGQVQQPQQQGPTREQLSEQIWDATRAQNPDQEQIQELLRQWEEVTGTPQPRFLGGVLKRFAKKGSIKKMAQAYGGDPADYQRMVKNVEASLEKVTEKLNAAGIPSITWNDAMKDIISGSELGKLFSYMPYPGEDMDELDQAAIEFVNEMLKRYSDNWKPDEGMPEDLFGSLMKPMYQQQIPVAPEEEIEEGTYIPGVDYSMIEKLILSWDQEIDPLLMQLTDQYVQEAKANFKAQAEGMNELVRRYQNHPQSEEILGWVMHDLNAALANQFGYNTDYRGMLKDFKPENMPAIMTAMYMTGFIDPYDFSFRNSSVVGYWEDAIEDQY